MILQYVSLILSPARQLDGVNLRGFYFWKLQDRHVPQYGLFASVQHQSKAKASVGVYRDIIAHGGFPTDNATHACRSPSLQEPCSLCEWMFQNKALLVFGGSLLITAIMLAALVIFVIVTKRRQTYGRVQGIHRMNRRRRREPVIICSCPLVKHRL